MASRPMSRRHDDDAVSAELVRAAVDGDAAAWHALMERYADRIRAVTLSHRLSDADAGDIAQTTWLRAFERLGRLREPERVGAWLVTVARRECLQALRTAARQIPTDGQRLAEEPDGSAGPDAQLLESEQRALVRRAWSRLTPRDRTLLMLLHRDPAPSYEDIGLQLGMPVGSIGPTRARALQRLRENLESTQRPLSAAGSGARQPAGLEDRLEAFAADVFASMSRKDQRRCGVAYLRELVLPDGSRSLAHRAARMPDESLRQFVNQSPWAWQPVRRRLAARMTTAIDPEAWVVEDIELRVRGRWSVGVGRQSPGAAGNVANCQVGVAIVATGKTASCPLNWRIFLPPEWDTDGLRRATAHVPSDVRHEPRWTLAMAMIDELQGWGIEPPVICAGAAYGGVAAFRRGLDERGVRYVLRVRGATPACAPEGPAAATVRDVALGAGRRAVVGISWPEEGRRAHAHFVTARIGDHRVLAEWWPNQREPTTYWLSNVAADAALHGLVRKTKLGWRVERCLRELKDDLGLDRFEGRSYRGWHHHTTLASVAQAFLALERSRGVGARRAGPAADAGATRAGFEVGCPSPLAVE